MKNIEAVVPQMNVDQIIGQLQTLEVEDVVVETVKVFKKNLHQTMIHRGCKYEQNFTFESKLSFQIADQDAPRAETILAHATRH